MEFIMVFACSVLGLTLGLAGSIVLALCLDPLLKMLVAAVSGHELSIETLSRPRGDAVVFSGFDEQLERAAKRTTLWTRLGFILLAASFLAQLVALALQLFSSRL